MILGKYIHSFLPKKTEINYLAFNWDKLKLINCCQLRLCSPQLKIVTSNSDFACCIFCTFFILISSICLGLQENFNIIEYSIGRSSWPTRHIPTWVPRNMTMLHFSLIWLVFLDVFFTKSTTSWDRWPILNRNHIISVLFSGLLIQYISWKCPFWHMVNDFVNVAFNKIY